MSALQRHPWSTKQRARAMAAVRRAVDYLRGRQSANGGFCFYRWLGIDEPNLHDTWHAIGALTLMGAPVPRAAAAAASLGTYLVASPEALYQRTFALARLGFEARIDGLDLRRIRALDPAAAIAGDIPLKARLAMILRILCLRQRFDAVPVEQVPLVQYVKAQCRAGAWGDKANLPDTALALAILDRLHEPADDAATRVFIWRLQVPEFGFTATTDSLFGDLDTVHAGLAACRLLDLAPVYGVAAADYVLACQSSNGGFARTPDALPDIAHTHRALQALALAGVADAALAPAPLAPTL